MRISDWSSDVCSSDLTDMRAGFLVGLSIATGYVLQTMGLQTIPSSKSAFITALYVPLVPILQWLVLRRPPGIMAWTGAGFAFAGMLALAGPDGIAGSLGKGEWLTIISTLVIAGEIIAIGHYAPKVDARRITIIKTGREIGRASCRERVCQYV